MLFPLPGMLSSLPNAYVMVWVVSITEAFPPSLLAFRPQVNLHFVNDFLPDWVCLPLHAATKILFLKYRPGCFSPFNNSLFHIEKMSYF